MFSSKILRLQKSAHISTIWWNFQGNFMFIFNVLSDTLREKCPNMDQKNLRIWTLFMHFWCSWWICVFLFSSWDENVTFIRPKKMLLFLEMWVTRKIVTRAAANLFFKRFSGDIIFSSLVSFAFFVFLFLFCCLCFCFLKLKIYIMIQMRRCGRLGY